MDMDMDMDRGHSHVQVVNGMPHGHEYVHGKSRVTSAATSSMGLGD